MRVLPLLGGQMTVGPICAFRTMNNLQDCIYYGYERTLACYAKLCSPVLQPSKTICQKQKPTKGMPQKTLEPTQSLETKSKNERQPSINQSFLESFLSTLKSALSLNASLATSIPFLSTIFKHHPQTG